MNTFKKWVHSGSPWIWLNAGCVAVSLILVVGLLGLIAVRGLGHFWPGAIAVLNIESQQGNMILAGELTDKEAVSKEQLRAAGIMTKKDQHFHNRYLVKVGNRELNGRDFTWILEEDIKEKTYPSSMVTIERWEWGNFYGEVEGIKEQGKLLDAKQNTWDELQARVKRTNILHDQIHALENKEFNAINYEKENLHLDEKKLHLDKQATPEKLEKIATQIAELDERSKAVQVQLHGLYEQVKRDTLVLKTISGQQIDMPLSKVVSVYRPNDMSIFQKVGFYFAKIWEFLSEEPREANTEGGIFPAIFGTVLMVLVMSIIVTPVGVIAAVYLREYAKQGKMTRMIRIAVNNLAGVPSIVYGVFGLGFFVYFLGEHIDELFFQAKLPAPTFGTPGLMWASITLALLTLPVVIVATEEGLARIPRSIREGSLALGATQAETIWRVVLPMTGPAIMTGLILAIARAAGEVAPLMLVGVVKLAPALPLDSSYPFLHLDRKFMHLGFHIYDVGFQSPNVEAARPLVYATAFLLVVVIVILNVTAISIRNNLREKYKSLEM